MSLVLTTDAVDARHRVAFWQDMVCRTFVKAQCASNIGESFRGRIVTDDLGELEISRIDAGRQRIDRRRVDIANCDRPRYYLCYQATGRARFVERNSDNILSAGDMVLLNNREPYSAEYEDRVSEIVLHVPQDLLRERFRNPDRCVGRKLSGQRAITRITADFLMSYTRVLDALTDSQRALAAQMALNLVTQVLIDETSGEGSAGMHQAILMARIKQFILTRIAQPDLHLRTVADGVGVSSRYVSRLFQQEGNTFGHFLLQKRLEHCKAELANPQLQNLQISEIAGRSGFKNLSHFSRVFRENFGRSPREYRTDPEH